MDKLVNELLSLLRDLLAGQQQLLQLGLSRRDAMRTFDISRMEMLTSQEKATMDVLASLDRRRQQLTAQVRSALPRNVEPTISEIARRCQEPQKSQLLGLAAQLKETVEQVDRNTRINATISEAVIKGLAKVLKVVTGLAQHAGLYMRNGRKAAMHGIHLLEVTA
jgi:flagellar biosynthesis/type III secretory pathway chaperone